MDRKIKELVSALKVKIVYVSNMDNDAYYISKLNIIVISNAIPDFDQKKALLHELKHAASHKNEIELYNLAFSLHSKMEYQAECFMIKEMLDDYIQNTGLEPSQVNRINFLESCNIDTSYEGFVHDCLIHYVKCVNYA